MLYNNNNKNKKWISSGSDFESEMCYSRAVIDDDYIFVSGTTGFDYESMQLADTLLEQAEQCFINIEKVLKEAGSDCNHIVRVRYIFPNRLDFKLCLPIISKYLGEARPAATFFVADLFDEKMKLAIEVPAKVINQDNAFLPFKM